MIFSITHSPAKLTVELYIAFEDSISPTTLPTIADEGESVLTPAIPHIAPGGSNLSGPYIHENSSRFSIFSSSTRYTASDQSYNSRPALLSNVPPSRRRLARLGITRRLYLIDQKLDIAFGSISVNDLVNRTENSGAFLTECPLFLAHSLTVTIDITLTASTGAQIVFKAAINYQALRRQKLSSVLVQLTKLVNLGTAISEVSCW